VLEWGAAVARRARRRRDQPPVMAGTHRVRAGAGGPQSSSPSSSCRFATSPSAITRGRGRAAAGRISRSSTNPVVGRCRRLGAGAGDRSQPDRRCALGRVTSRTRAVGAPALRGWTSRSARGLLALVGRRAPARRRSRSVLGFLEPTRGTVRGRDARSRRHRPGGWRRRVCVVPQRPHLFHGRSPTTSGSPGPIADDDAVRRGRGAGVEVVPATTSPLGPRPRSG
jgi:hypothetical protein